MAARAISGMRRVDAGPWLVLLVIFSSVGGCLFGGSGVVISVRAVLTRLGPSGQLLCREVVTVFL